MKVMFLAFCALLAALAVAVAPAAADSSIPSNVALCKGFEFEFFGNQLTIYVRSDGSSFANYPDCVTYAAKGGTVIRKSQFDCQSSGGTFVFHNFPVIGFLTSVWTCDHYSVTVANAQDRFNQLSADCVADVLAAGGSTADVGWTVQDIPGSGNVVECAGG